ncbi:MAG: HEPN domain-containing protein [Candidatus Hydrogenedentota bacterium]
MDVEKQITYWANGSKSDIEAARLLVNGGKARQGLFLAHLALEKALKAHVVKASSKHPPKVHSLLILTQRTNLEIPTAQLEFLGTFDVYQLQGRYPDTELPELSDELVQRDFKQAGEVQQWLIRQL